MTPSKREGSRASGMTPARWFGRFRVLPDGRLRFSPWSYRETPYVSLKVANDRITVVSAGLMVMFLYLERNRIVSACFLFDLTPEQLRTAVADLRDARQGLDSWVVPALEYTYAVSTAREDNPEMFKVILELLESCRDLPVAKQWQRSRAQYFVNQGVTPPELSTKGSTPARKPRRKATQPRKTAPRK